jgi:hypothetical protein
MPTQLYLTPKDQGRRRTWEEFARAAGAAGSRHERAVVARPSLEEVGEALEAGLLPQGDELGLGAVLAAELAWDRAPVRTARRTSALNGGVKERRARFGIGRHSEKPGSQ